jgi:hypothetical protein
MTPEEFTDYCKKIMAFWPLNDEWPQDQWIPYYQLVGHEPLIVAEVALDMYLGRGTGFRPKADELLALVRDVKRSPTPMVLAAIERDRDLPHMAGLEAPSGPATGTKVGARTVFDIQRWLADQGAESVVGLAEKLHADGEVASVKLGFLQVSEMIRVADWLEYSVKNKDGSPRPITTSIGEHLAIH